MDDILKDALEMFRESEDGSLENRKDALEDIKFARLGEQWPKEIKQQRRQENRPCLTINRLPAFIRQVVNESRQNKPGIIVSPVDNGADVETAQVISGLIRSIERRSSAEVAYDTAIDHSVSGGFGFFRLGIDYVDPDSFDLECRIDRIPNPLMVHWDVASTSFDASDWRYAFVSDFLTRDEFRKRFPDASPVEFAGEDADDWAAQWLADEDMVRLSEFWLREEKKRTIMQLSNGSVIRKDTIPKLVKDMAEQVGQSVDGVSDDEVIGLYLQMTGTEVLRTREATYHDVKRRLISGAEVLEEEDWPGSMIPICPVWGDEVVIEGRRHFRSMIRDARDPQMMFNFWRTASTELVALAPKAPWVGPAGFAEGFEDKWQTANTRSHGYMEYNTDAGPAPQRQPFAGIPGGAIQEALNASDDMKATTGIYDSSLGAQSNETSGRAILARQRESDVSNFHFIDNLSHAITYAGKCLVEILPSVYTPGQTIRILGDDQKEEVIKLGSQVLKDGQPVLDENGQPKLYDLSVGRYDVTVSSGPSHATQREESREFLLEIMRQVPGAAPLIGDIVVEKFDFEGAAEIAERLRSLQNPAQPGQPGIPGAAPAQPIGVPGVTP